MALKTVVAELEGRVTQRSVERRGVRKTYNLSWLYSFKQVERETRVWEGLTKGACDYVIDNPPVSVTVEYAYTGGLGPRTIRTEYSYSAEEENQYVGNWTLTRTMERTTTQGQFYDDTPPD